MPSVHAGGISLSIAEEIKQCMLETVKQFHNEAEKSLSEINPLNETFDFLNHRALLRGGSTDKDMNKFNNIHEDDVDLSEVH